MAEINLQRIGKDYNKGVTAVKNFNLHIEDKEFIVLVGPSGCGKSTVLRMIAGLENITEGEFHIDGKRMNDISPKDRDVAFVFQNYALYPHMNVYQNMSFGLKTRKFAKSEIEQRVKNAAQLLGLEPFLHRKPVSLSGGQRQRVALGRAIVRDAQVFLMDEPLSNLDAKLRVQMRSEITKLHQRLETTTIYVTHDQTEALTMASRLVVMNDGEIQQVGTPKEVYEMPSNIFVGGFIGSPGMNFFAGTLLEDGRVDIGRPFIQVPEERLNELGEKGYVNKKIIVGIRPENIYFEQTLNQNITSPSTTIDIKVEVTEMLGAETIIYSHIADQPIITRLDPDIPVKVGQDIKLVADLNKTHYFDSKTEKRIKVE